mmetsp:Transcript_14908/g.24913  ORF Transcript_14908/g.24913 Transcript_14908/m.24913 type:complete len:125 (-) Transcript_14908:451-825(-)
MHLESTIFAIQQSSHRPVAFALQTLPCRSVHDNADVTAAMGYYTFNECGVYAVGFVAVVNCARFIESCAKSLPPNVSLHVSPSSQVLRKQVRRSGEHDIFILPCVARTPINCVALTGATRFANE